MKKDISILIGNALDRFDTSLYGFLAPVMGPIFFPDYDPVVQLILTYATSITSLVSRPLGTLIFGIIARNKGPVFGLSYSLIGVAITTVCIGCIPSYATIGAWAPLSLIIIRIIRGICAAGESVIAKLYIMENKSDKQALAASHLYQSSSMVGIVMASAASAIVIRGGDNYTWRLCFLIGGITGFAGYFLRYCACEEAEIKQSDSFKGYSVSNLRLLWNNRDNIMRVAVATCFSHITYAIPFVFMNSFVPLITSISLTTMMMLNTTLLIFDMICIPIIGRFVMRYVMDKVMISAITMLAITIIPLFIFLPQASLMYVTCMRFWIVFWGLVFLCPLNFWFNRLFATSDKYFLVGMGTALGTATLGHMTTPICLWLWYISGVSYAPALYMVIIMSVTVYAIKTSRKNRYFV